VCRSAAAARPWRCRKSRSGDHGSAAPDTRAPQRRTPTRFMHAPVPGRAPTSIRSGVAAAMLRAVSWISRRAARDCGRCGRWSPRRSAASDGGGSTRIRLRFAASASIRAVAAFPGTTCSARARSKERARADGVAAPVRATVTAEGIGTTAQRHRGGARARRHDDVRPCGHPLERAPRPGPGPRASLPERTACSK
jgi:hypothetical protein